MTPDELRMLTDLANKIAQTPAPPRDPEAEAFIRTRVGARPDALYLMTQTVLIQNLALRQAQEQIRALQQQQAAQPAFGAGSGGSFLGGLGQQPANAAPPQQPFAPPAAAPPSALGGAPSFLRGAATTAAGVAAGALAFEGIRSLFSHPGYGMGSSFGGFGGAPIEETVVNNYYDSPAHEGHTGHSLADTSDSGSDDVQAQDADYDDSNSGDDSSYDDDSTDVA